ncbi:MAG TPA: hypothetical protein GXX15_01650 [Clostridia bacterium]|nr:hypothetical protein [Clostridia bacterium]
MRLKFSKIKNFVFGKILYDEENVNEYIDLLFEKYGEEFFKEMYLEYQKEKAIDVAFKDQLLKCQKLKPLNVKKLNSIR